MGKIIVARIVFSDSNAERYPESVFFAFVNALCNENHDSISHNNAIANSIAIAVAFNVFIKELNKIPFDNPVADAKSSQDVFIFDDAERKPDAFGNDNTFFVADGLNDCLAVIVHVRFSFDIANADILV